MRPRAAGVLMVELSTKAAFSLFIFSFLCFLRRANALITSSLRAHREECLPYHGTLKSLIGREINKFRINKKRSYWRFIKRRRMKIGKIKNSCFVVRSMPTTNQPTFSFTFLAMSFSFSFAHSLGASLIFLCSYQRESKIIWASPFFFLPVHEKKNFAQFSFCLLRNF